MIRINDICKILVDRTAFGKYVSAYSVGDKFPPFGNVRSHYMIAYISAIQLDKRTKTLISHDEQPYNEGTLTTAAEKDRILNNKYNENKP
jgi:hypothetical protein